MTQIGFLKAAIRSAEARLFDCCQRSMINYDQMPLSLLDRAGKCIGLNAKDRNRGKHLHQVMKMLKGIPYETFLL